MIRGTTLDMEVSAREAAEKIRKLLLENQAFQNNCDWAADGPNRYVTTIFDWKVMVDRDSEKNREMLRILYGDVALIDEGFDGCEVFQTAQKKALSPSGVLSAFTKLAELAEMLEESRTSDKADPG